MYNFLDATSLTRGIRDYNKLGELLANARDLVLTGTVASIGLDESIFNQLMADYIEDRERARKWFERVGSDSKVKLLIEQQMIMNR